MRCCCGIWFIPSSGNYIGKVTEVRSEYKKHGLFSVGQLFYETKLREVRLKVCVFEAK